MGIEAKWDITLSSKPHILGQRDHGISLIYRQNIGLTSVIKVEVEYRQFPLQFDPGMKHMKSIPVLVSDLTDGSA